MQTGMKWLNRVDASSTDGTVIVEFGAEWCGPCKVLLPVLKELSQKYSEKIAVATLDIAANIEIAKKHGVTNIPCLVVFKNGKEVERKVGYSGREAVEKLFIKHN